jgi:ATP-dependent protease ClpP protease subunit
MSCTINIRAVLLTAWIAAMCFSPAVGQPTVTFDELIRQGYRYSPPTNKCSPTGCDFHVNGVITKNTVEQFGRFLAAVPSGRYLTVWFDSGGGDVDSAMKFGRMLRDHGPASAVISGGTCASACVLALVGATSRNIKTSKIGIHRPYSTSPGEQSRANHAQNYRKLEERIRKYLADMNIPPALLDEMLRYESESMHYMSEQDLSRYRLNKTDHVWQDRVDSEVARRYGLDKATYLQRKVEADSTCTQALDSEESARAWVQCTERIYRGPK